MRRRGGPVGVALVAAALVVAGCDGPPPAERSEVFPQVEVRFDRAVRKALDEVPESRLLSVGLREPSETKPVWRTEVATPDGAVRVVRVDATLGRLLGSPEPADRRVDAEARTSALVESARILPEEAAETVAATAMESEHFGKVTEVRLAKGEKGRTVWVVTVAAIEPGRTHTYQVDAVTSDVIADHAPAATPVPTPGLVTGPSRTTGPR
ncbi:MULTISPECIES: PepSY domain-containing protein [unclassified Streptomyces]|uniref:PepSY domain-containing protein n=1 Tax=unclassified Streptomyces TaxID=2593676 RepID=UPI003D73F5A7